MSTFAVFLSFSFLFHFYIHKIRHLWSFMKKSFFVYLHSYTWQTFSVHVLELFLFTSHGLYTNPIYIQRFFRFFQCTPTVHTKVSLYTLVVHTHKNFSPRIIYKKLSMHIFLSHTYINIFLFLYIRRHFIHNASFFLSWFWFILFLFWTMLLKNEKIYTIPELQQTLWTNNEANTNITIQTTCMHKTKVNQNETNVSPSSYRNKITHKW